MSLPFTRVAIQGDRASFHEIAAHHYLHSPIDLSYCDSFTEVFTQLMSGKTDKALVAIKNSAHGSISEVQRLIDAHDVMIEGEYELEIQQHLIGVSGATVSEIKKVISHPVALSQCDHYLAAVLGNADQEPYHDTAAAVALVRELHDPSIAAIGSEAAAKLYGLEIINRSIQNSVKNTTTFLLLARREDDKKFTSPMFASRASRHTSR